MTDGPPPGGTTNRIGGKGGYVLDSRRSEAETTVGYIINNSNKIRILRILIKTNFISILITVYIGGA